jgi:predicted lipase
LTPYPCDGCLVNKGFYQAWLNLKNDVIKTLEKFTALYRSAWVIVVGHNLGGAIAVLASVDIIDIFGSRGFHFVFTFGQPRVGNTNFAECLNKKLENKNSFRFVHYADPIPHFPPLGSYRHGITEFWYDEGMIYLD